MKKQLLVLVLFTFTLTAESQDDQENIYNELVDLSGIFDTKFLSKKNEALSKIVGEAKIILLGEQHHGDGNAFEVKTRLIEYLHKYHDFDVVLFETDFFGGFCSLLHDDTRVDVEEFKKTTFKFWRESTQMNPFWQFVEKEADGLSPIALGGFDTHHFSRISKNSLVRKLDSLVKRSNLPDTNKAKYNSFKEVLENFLIYKHPENSKTKEAFFEMLVELRSDLINAGISSNSFWIKELKNIERSSQFAWEGVYRDKGMAENIIWLKEQHFNDRKIIIWAQNAHIFKEVESWYKGIPSLVSQFDAFDDKEMGIAMGNILSKRYEQKLKSFGIISYSGYYSSRTFANDFSTIEKINGENYSGLASQLHKSELDYGILPIDPSKRDIFNRLTLNASGHNFESKAKWGEIFDAIIFIDEIQPIELK